MSKVIRIDLPFFPGFYESIYEDGDTEYNAINEKIDYFKNEVGEEHEYDDFDFDYQQRQEDIIEGFIDAFERHTPECVESVKYVGLSSPAYYNYSTDKIYADITLTDNWVEDFKKFIADNRDKLSQQIDVDWSSRSGFISFIEHPLSDFEKILFDETHRDQDMYLGIMLEYFMEYTYLSKRHYCSELYMEIALDVLDEIYDSNYVKLKELS